jgi:hypothetical protein
MGAISNRYETENSFSHAPRIVATQSIKDCWFGPVNCGAWEMWGNGRDNLRLLPCTLQILSWKHQDQFLKKNRPRIARGKEEGKRGKEEKKGKESWLGPNKDPEAEVAVDAVSPPPVAIRRTAGPRIADPRTTTQELGLFIVNLHHFLKKSLLVIVKFYC